MRKTNWKRLGVLALSAVMSISLAACGSKSAGSDVRQKEWVYVPTFLETEEENANYYDMQMAGDGLYYVSYDWNEETFESSQSICKYSLADGSVTSVPIAWEDEENEMNLGRFVFAEDCSMYAVAYVYPKEPDANGNYESQELLCRFDAAGKLVFSQDLTKLMSEDPENSYVNNMAVDGQGRIYVSGHSVIWLFDTEGKYQGSVSAGSTANSWINAMGCGKDGKVYISSYNYDGTSSSYSLTEIDFDNKKAGATYGNFPEGNHQKLVAGIEKDFLVHDGNTVYEYDMATQTKEPVFDWLDSDINGSTVQTIGAMEDGRILAVIVDWENDDNGIALLTKTKASEVAQREIIVIASMYNNSDLKAAAVKFNKSNEKYRISIKNYVDYDSFSETTWSDALTKLINDLTSRNCPDIVDLSGLNVNQLAAKGVFEDLNTYLEKSEVLKRSDFVENILNAYTLDNVLVSIPAYFEMQTVIGSAEKVGAEMGWTLEELMAFADKYPEAELFDRVQKNTMMYYLMMYNENAFIDWGTGECKFDTDQFKNLLTFVNRFPDEVHWEEGQASTPTRVQRGEVLLETAYIYDFEAIQQYIDMFQGEITCIGFPAADGSSGCALRASQAYAITSKSKMKDGAWEFIESFLAQEDNGRYWYGFPSVKSKLDAMIEEVTKVEYLTDENGELVLDENGQPIEMGGGGGIGYEDGYEYTFHTPTREEVDLVLSLMEVARPVASNNDQIMAIINEEAAGYWEGQKTVDEVAGIIQSRVQIYVDENR